MEFPGFLGNAPVKEALSRAFSAGRFPHALLFAGERGTGKRTLAALIAKSLVCRDREHAPCGICPSCIRADAGSHPDIRTVEGGGASGDLNVDAARAMLEDAYRMPEEAPNNVYIVRLSGNTSNTAVAAQNKLLKLIEEPPDSAVFILLCPTVEAVLPTIRSRTQIFNLYPPEIGEAADWLRGKKGVEPEAALELSRRLGGNLGRMQEALDGSEATRAFMIAGEIVSAINGPGHRLLKAAAPLQRDRALFGETLGRLSLIFRDAFTLNAGGSSLLGGAPEAAEALRGFSQRRLMAMKELTDEALQMLGRNGNSGLLLTFYCAGLRQGDV